MQNAAPVRHISQIFNLPLFTRAKLEEQRRSIDPSVDPGVELKWRRTTVKDIMRPLCQRLKLYDWVYENAMVYVHRFYLSRSLHKNDRYLVTGAAVLLASKVQECHRSVDDVSLACFELKHANKPDAWPNAHDKAAALAAFKEGILLAERNILFAINFNVVVPASANLVLEVFREEFQTKPPNPSHPPEGMSAEEALGLMRVWKSTMQLIGDSYMTSLCLQHPQSTLVPVLFTLSAKMLAKSPHYINKAPPACIQRLLTRGPDILHARGISAEAATEVEAQMNAVYANPSAAKAQHPPQQQQQQPAAHAQQQQQQAAHAQQQQQHLASSSSSLKPDPAKASVLSAPRTPPAQSTPAQAEGSPEEGELPAEQQQQQGGDASTAAAAGQQGADAPDEASSHTAAAAGAPAPSQLLGKRRTADESPCSDEAERHDKAARMDSAPAIMGAA